MSAAQEAYVEFPGGNFIPKSEASKMVDAVSADAEKAQQGSEIKQDLESLKKWLESLIARG